MNKLDELKKEGFEVLHLTKDQKPYFNSLLDCAYMQGRVEVSTEVLDDLKRRSK